MPRILLQTALLLTFAVSASAQGDAAECGCDDPLDVVILVDRSASISPTDYFDERTFIGEFVGRLAPLSNEQTRVAIAQFDVGAEIVLDFFEGTSSGNVDAAINTMSCECPGSTLDFSVKPWEVPPTRKDVCCAARSSISAAIDFAAGYLATNGRVDACKAVLVISDGGHNTLQDHVTSCNGAACAVDLTAAIEELASEVPGVALWGAGVGDTDHWKMGLIDGGRFGKLTSDLAGVLDCPSE